MVELNIAVIGDLMIDNYIWGSCDRISPEAPVQVVLKQSSTSLLGGAGNVVNNLNALNVKVSLFSVIGDDDNAKELIPLLENTNSYLATQKGRITTKKSRIMVSKHQVLRVDEESNTPIDKTSEDIILKEFKAKVKEFDAVIISDYGKGVITKKLAQEIITFANKYKKPILVDPKGKDYSKYKGATLITPNKKEAQLASNIEIDNNTTLQKTLEHFKSLLNLKYSLITLSQDGIALLDKNLHIIPTVAKEVYDVTGAGDTVIASLAVALSRGKSIYEACKFANSAAAVVVGKVGSATATYDEIKAYENILKSNLPNSKTKSFKEIENISKLLKSQDKKVVFTNGCFDILHSGHTTYLQKAKELGDVLILGLNSDNSIKRLKGKNRPINSLEERATVLSALSSVDYIVPFEEDTPYELIKIVEPDILVKGADYKDKEIVGSDIAKEVKLIEFVDGKSTTNIIKKIECKE